MDSRESQQDHVITPWESLAYEGTGYYETQGDHVTVWDGEVLPLE